jgi:hypothetical protein
MSEDVRSRIAAIIRQDLADEAAAGFPLVRRFPNSETASVPDYFSKLSQADGESLLDALAHYSTLKWSHDIVREKDAHPVLGRYLYKQPAYPPGDWYGARAKKPLLKKAMAERLTNAGFARKNRPGGWPPDVMGRSSPDPSFQGHLVVGFAPGLRRQMSFGFRDWMRADLVAHLEPLGPREFIPIVKSLTYDHLWHGSGVNDPNCWDVIAERDLEQTGDLLVEILERLARLAGRINGLAPTALR